MARTLFFMKRHSLLILGLVLVGTMTLAALLAPWLRTHDPIAMNPESSITLPKIAPSRNMGKYIFTKNDVFSIKSAM